MGRYVMAIDAGTTSIRTLIVDPEMSICASASIPVLAYFPEPGWVEQEPEEIWSAVLSTMRRALFDATLDARDLAGLALTNQRETVVVWERATGTAVHRALVWQDRRTTATCEALGREGASDWVQARSGLRLDPYFSASKISWILDHVPGLRARAGRGEICAGTVDSWILWRLSGGRVHATDVTNASRTSLMNLTSLKWDDDLCELFEVPREVLANIEPSEHDFCETDHEVLGAPVLVAAIIGDQQAALLGQGCREEGQTKNTYGTGSFLLQHTGEHFHADSDSLIATVAASAQGAPTQYALEGSIFVTGAALQWLRDGLGIIDTVQESEFLAESLTDNGDVWFVPALTGLGSPHWDAHARGTVLGISRGTTRAHLARAALESIAYQTRDVLDAMNRQSRVGVGELKVDGGACANRWLMQFQSDVLGIPLLVAPHSEATALGAAFAAGVHSRVWSRHDELSALLGEGLRYEPTMSADQRDTLHARWSAALQRSRHWSS